MRILALILLAMTVLAPAPALAVHDNQGDTKCLDCHKTLPFDRAKLAYTDGVSATCRKCHQQFPCQPQPASTGFTHPLDVVPTMSIPKDMPLTESGKLTCITCHSYHAEFWDAEYKTEFLLRRAKGPGLCKTCHPQLPGP